MDPYLEQRLRDEVIYLHSLWHQGPPNRRNPNPPTRPAAISPQFHYPIAAATRKTAPEYEIPTPTKNPPQPDPRWEAPGPADSTPAAATSTSTSTWAVGSPKLNSAASSDEEEKLRRHAMRLHARALELCRGFFAGSGSGSDSEEEEEEEEEEDDGNEEEYKLFLKLFVEERELRSFYEGNWDGGEFYCLVCGALGKRKWIKGCAGLVQHAVTVSKTKKKRAHRAFGQVVCRVLGWDVKKMPFIVLKGETLGFYLANPGTEQGVREGNAGDNVDVSGGIGDNVGDGRENPLKGACVNQENETIDKGILETKEEKEAVTLRREPEVSADHLDSVLKDNVAAANEATSEAIEKETSSDNQSNGKDLMICQSSLKPPIRPTGNPQLPYQIAAAHQSPAAKRKTRTEINIYSPNKKPSQPDPHWESPGPAWNNASTTSNWPLSQPKLSLAPASEEKQLRHHAIQLHKRALKVCGRLFAGSGSGSESEEENDDEDCRDGENEEYTLFLKLFLEDSELRSYYERNWDGGEFHCLVCDGLGKTKRIKGCAGLVQHAITVSKTKKKRAHRAFGQVVCRVLGWDVKRMPFVVLKGETLSFYLANPGTEQGEPKVNAGVKDIVVDERDVDAMSAEKEAPDEDVMIFQNSLGDDNANQCKETLHKRISETKEDREEAIDTLCEPEVNANKLDNVLEDNAAAVNDATAKSSVKEAIRDPLCNDRKLMICQISLKDEGKDKSSESLDEGNISIKEAIREEAEDALGAGLCEGDFGGIKDNVGAKNDANAALVENEMFNDHQITGENQIISQVEVAENADNDKHDLVVSKENLDFVSGYTGEIGSKEEPLGDGTPIACELQAEPEKNVDGPNDDLNFFLENLEPL